MGPKGTVAAARTYLANVELADFNCETAADFAAVLDYSTGAFIKSVKYWGAARKFLNIFLRDVVYCRYLCDEYGLSHIVPWLEVPLDSHVASGLRAEPGGSKLPRWKTVIGLKPDLNRIYQDFAAYVAAGKGCERVHLDLIYWRRHLHLGTRQMLGARS